MRGVYRAQSHPAASLWTWGFANRRFAQSPIDALIDIKVGCRLRRQIPVRLAFDTLVHLRITVIPQWRPACPYMCGGSESTPM